MTRIIVPPGIGDIYWVTVKLASFLKKNQLTDPEITIVSHPDKENGHLRSIEFLEMLPWIRVGNPCTVPNAPGLEHIWNEAYAGPGKSIFPGIMGYDYFMAYNGCINSGGWLETVDEYDCDWSTPIAQSPIIPTVGSYNNFMLCFFPFFGTFITHERDFPILFIAESINRFADKSGLTPVFIGSKQELVYNPRRHELMALVSGSIDLVGQTTLKDVFGLIQGSQFILGYHSGIPNLAAAFGKRTVLLWDNRYPPSTAYACMPPQVRTTTYHAISTNGLTVNGLVHRLEMSCGI